MLRRPERHEVSHPQLGELFDQELRPVSSRKRSGQFEAETHFALNLLNGLDLERHTALPGGANHCAVIAAIAIEQVNLLAGANPAHMEKVMRFRPFQNNGSWDQ